MVIKRPSWRQLRWMLGGSLLLCAIVWLWLTGRALPHGYIIALVDEENSATAWLSRLRDAPRRFG